MRVRVRVRACVPSLYARAKSVSKPTAGGCRAFASSRTNKAMELDWMESLTKDSVRAETNDVPWTLDGHRYLISSFLKIKFSGSARVHVWVC